jgi:hypothetical protein
MLTLGAREPTSVGQLVGKVKWEKAAGDWIVASGVGLFGPAKQDFETERGEWNDVWRRDPCF